MSNGSRIVIGVAGRIGSGKSKIARTLEQDLQFQYLRYSMVLAEWFAVDPEDKVRLQDVGGEVMSGEGQGELNQRLIAGIDRRRDAVVDGLRHPIDHDSLKAAFGSRYSLVFVETPAEIRFERTRDRYQTEAVFRAADSRPVETHIDSLRPMAKEVISGTMAPGKLNLELRRIVDRFRERVSA